MKIARFVVIGFFGFLLAACSQSDLQIRTQDDTQLSVTSGLNVPDFEVTYDYDYGEAPLDVTFTLRFSSPHNNQSGYRYDFLFGDGQSIDQISYDDTVTLTHTYNTQGDFEPSIAVSYGDDPNSARVLGTQTIKVVNSASLISDTSNHSGVWVNSGNDFVAYSPVRWHMGGERSAVLMTRAGAILELQVLQNGANGGEWVSAPNQVQIPMWADILKAVKGPSDNAWYRWKITLPVSAMEGYSQGSYSLYYR